ncbi:MAG: type II toxin-antitoxin system RelE/ParE family toxin [Marinobacter sp.]|uniref:type II toxin-antitoxin system RelE/ParE family toxin n=1 Tax=Marinobacter sp. TaxID=50741 RepID=UPI0034A03198
MASYRLTPDAQTDLVGIRRFTLARWGADQSRKYLSGLRQTLQLLTENPSLGKARPEIGPGVLSFPHGSHIIYYLVHTQQPVVFGVLHKRMVPADHLSEREIG